MMDSAGNGTSPISATERHGLNRREFISQAIAAGVSAPILLSAIEHSAGAQETTAKRDRKIKLGVVGCGGRGAWITNLFAEDGGYEIYAVADYFQNVADRSGDSHKVDAKRRFSGLQGYRRLLESGVEAVALETPPGFFPEHASAAVDAGVHVYMAKPVACDVPGCHRIEAAGKKATANKKVFLIDYQIPTDPNNIEVVRQLRAGAIGKPVVMNSYYFGAPWNDPPFTANLESRLQNLIWVNDDAVGGGYHVNACIHAIDAGLWLANELPTRALGISRFGRKTPHGDSHDVYALTFEFPSGLVLQHRGKHIGDQSTNPDFCGCSIHGQGGSAQISYSGKAWLLSPETAIREDVPNLYELGARRNIATFYKNVTEGETSNPTVRHAVDSALVTILGREAGRRKTSLTMAQLLKENKVCEMDLKGLKP